MDNLKKQPKKAARVGAKPREPTTDRVARAEPIAKSKSRIPGAGGALKGKKPLDTFPYRNVLLAHGTSSDNLGCV
jgi:hypothetical protein